MGPDSDQWALMVLNLSFSEALPPLSLGFFWGIRTPHRRTPTHTNTHTHAFLAAGSHDDEAIHEATDMSKAGCSTAGAHRRAPQPRPAAIKRWWLELSGMPERRHRLLVPASNHLLLLKSLSVVGSVWFFFILALKQEPTQQHGFGSEFDVRYERRMLYWLRPPWSQPTRSPEVTLQYSGSPETDVDDRNPA